MNHDGPSSFFLFQIQNPNHNSHLEKNSINNFLTKLISLKMKKIWFIFIIENANDKLRSTNLRNTLYYISKSETLRYTLSFFEETELTCKS